MSVNQSPIVLAPLVLSFPTHYCPAVIRSQGEKREACLMRRRIAAKKDISNTNMDLLPPHFRARLCLPSYAYSFSGLQFQS